MHCQCRSWGGCRAIYKHWQKAVRRYSECKKKERKAQSQTDVYAEKRACWGERHSHARCARCIIFLRWLTCLIFSFRTAETVIFVIKDVVSPPSQNQYAGLITSSLDPPAATLFATPLSRQHLYAFKKCSKVATWITEFRRVPARRPFCGAEKKDSKTHGDR